MSTGEFLAYLVLTFSGGVVVGAGGLFFLLYFYGATIEESNEEFEERLRTGKNI